MYRKLNIKVLVAALAILFVALILTKVFNSKGKERTFTEDILSFDLTDISSFKIYPASDVKNSIGFKLEDNKWRVEKEDKSYLAEQSEVRNLLFLLRNADVERVVATSQEKWTDFKLDNENALVVEVSSKGKLESIFLGGYYYVSGKSDAENSAYPRGARYLTYVRINNDKKCYSVNGMIRPAFEKNVDDYRDKILMHQATVNWDKITIKGSDTALINYNKNDLGWLKDGSFCDSMKMVSYLRSLSKIKAEEFYHDNVSALGEPIQQLEISGDKMNKPIVISCYGNDTLKVFSSSLRPDDYFRDLNGKLEKKIFENKP